MEYLLRVEAVNLSFFTEDTTDLSTVRGGGLLLLHAIDRVQDMLKVWGLSVTPISTGASIGLFSFETEDPTIAEDLREKVAAFLAIEDNELKHATFVVDVQPKNNGFSEANEKALARNRFRQFRQPTVVVPEINTDPDRGPCDLDFIRPATCSSDSEKRSTSVEVRRKYGGKKKHYFYPDLFDRYHLEWKPLEFTNDLNTLTGDSDQGKLNGKMAVIYLDGNKFTGIREACRDDEEGVKRFDLNLKAKQAAMLHSLLQKYRRDPDFLTRDGQLRFETLVWGGDEIVWVVPAWRGWQVLQDFYRISKDWTFNVDPEKDTVRRLTHAGGLVFCNHKAPISRIKKLSHDLCEANKDKDKTENRFQYVTLKSFDHIGRDPLFYRRMQLTGAGAGEADRKTRELFGLSDTGTGWEEKADRKIKELFGVPGEAMGDWAAFIAKIKAEFPHGKVFSAVQAALQEDEYEKALERIAELLTGDALKTISKLSAILGEGRIGWMHLADLWDYIPEK